MEPAMNRHERRARAAIERRTGRTGQPNATPAAGGAATEGVGAAGTTINGAAGIYDNGYAVQRRWCRRAYPHQHDERRCHSRHERHRVTGGDHQVHDAGHAREVIRALDTSRRQRTEIRVSGSRDHFDGV